MFDMKKIFLVFVILFLLVPVSSFAYDGDYPPDYIIPYLNYDNHYVIIDNGLLIFLELEDIVYHVKETDGFSLRFNSVGQRWNYIDGVWVKGEKFSKLPSGARTFYNPEIIYTNIDIPFGFYNYETEKLESLDDGYFFRRTDLIRYVNFVTPPHGVQDSQSKMIFNISTEFNKLLTPDEIKNIDYKFYINGEKKNILKKLNEAFLPFSGVSTSHILSFEIIVPIGENFCEIIYYNDDGIEIGYGSTEFERLIGFIDADGDDLDDRTGRSFGGRSSRDDIDFTSDKPIKPDDDANAIDWLKYLAEYVGYIFEVLLNSISNFAKNVVSAIGSILGLAEPMFCFISQFFSSMPVEIRTGFIAMFSVSAFLVIMKMIRG